MRITASSDSWIGRALIDPDGKRLGTIEELYCNEQTGRAQWVVVRLGRFGRKRSFVPLNEARRTETAIVTPHAKSTIAGAPAAGHEDRLRADEVIALHRHYGLPHDALVEDAPPAPLSPGDRVLDYLKKSE